VADDNPEFERNGGSTSIGAWLRPNVKLDYHAPLFAVETRVNAWQSVRLFVRDVDGDGRDDLVLGYWKGLTDDRVVLERQFRYPLARDFIEIPAGKLEPGEDHLATAKRELLEETGYVAAEWRRLGLIHNAIGYSDEGIEIWIARGLQRRKQQLAEGEFLEVFALPLAEAQAMARDGRITDVKTIAGLLWAETLPAA